MIDAFYGSAPTLSIWNGCSQGGRQGITEAVRYPADFDGDRRRRAGGELDAPPCRAHGDQPRRQRDAGERDPALQVPGHSSTRRSRRATRETASTDGVIENPGACTFDPKVLQCSGARTTRRA